MMDFYADWGDKQGQDRGWQVDTRMKAICVFNMDQEFAPLLELAAPYRNDRRYGELLYLVRDMHRALPAMIAEIRMHRAAERGEAA
jgi:hypothetical protein